MQFGDYWPRVATVMDTMVAWFLTVYFGSTAGNLLVDSGAQVTMISKVMFDRLAPSYRPPLSSNLQTINAANGGQITTYGCATLSVLIARSRFSLDVIVADMGGIPGVLGMDFLAKNDAVLHCHTGKLEIGGKIISCHGHRPDEGGRVTVKETTTIPPGHVGQVEVNIERWGGSERLYDVVEPLPDVCNHEGILFPRGLILRSCYSVIFEVTNIGGSPCVLPPGLVLGNVQPADLVHDQPGISMPVTVGSIGSSDHDPPDELPAHLQALVDATVDLNAAQKKQVSSLLLAYEHCFEGGKYGLGTTDLVKHKINTGDHPPVKLPPRRYGWAQRRALSEEVDKMLTKGVIEESDSPWSSPPVLVRKKDGTLRFCVDFRKINLISRKDAFPLPRVDDCLDCLAGAQWFCTLDLASGFWQIAMEDEDKSKTAFSTPRGHYHFKVMPYGLCNSPATLERLMELVLRGLSTDQALCYMDDVITSGRTFGDCLVNLQEVLNRFSAAGLRLKPSKCQLFHTEVAFLGHLVGRQGVRPDPKKIEVVKDWPTPVNLHEVRSFTGFVSYYRKYVPNFSEIASPLNALTQKDQPFIWSQKCQLAFEILKEAMITSPILTLPREGFQVVLDTDASDSSIGGVLSQIIDGQEKVIAYASKTLSTSQRKYCTTYKELLAIVKMAKTFRPYLYGQPSVIVRTDHKALIWLQGFKDAQGMLARWLASLSEYDFTIVHREGKKHANADGCSRIPVRSCPRADCPDPNHDDKLANANITAWGVKNGQESLQSPPLSLFDSRDKVIYCTNTEVPQGANHAPVDPDRTPDSTSDPAIVCATHQQHNPNWLDTLTDADIQAAQEEDRDLAEVILWVNNGKRPDFRDIALAGSHIKNLWAQFNCLELSMGKLIRKGKLPNGEEVNQLVVPPALRRRIFDYLHSSRLGGHMGINKTIAKLRMRFYWSGYRDDVIRWCQWCDQCQKRKPNMQKKAPLQQKPVGMPLERVAIDIVGPLPETESKMKVILVIQDYFTKWTECYALPDQKSMTVADALVTNFFLRWGCPLQLHSDQGANFEAHLFNDLCKLLGICKTRTSPYRPQSDGLVERMNRSLQDMLAKLVEEDRSNWDEVLPYVASAYRATPHESTGITPNRMMLGRECDLPVDLVYGSQVPDHRPCPVEYVEWVRDALETSYERARQELGRAAQRQARHYNRLSGDPVYEVGDWVLLFYPPIANKKLGMKFLGPYKVVRKIGDVSYEIEAHHTGKTKVVHVNHLKPYLTEILPNDLQNLPDLPRSLDLDGLPQELGPQDPPCDTLVDLEGDSEQPEHFDTGPGLENLFQEESPALAESSAPGESPAQDPVVPLQGPKRARQPPNRFGHNVGFS